MVPTFRYRKEDSSQSFKTKDVDNCLNLYKIFFTLTFRKAVNVLL